MLWKISTVRETVGALQESARNCKESLDYNKEIRKALSDSLREAEGLRRDKQRLEREKGVESKKVRQLEVENEEYQKLISEQRNEKVEMIERQLTSEETKLGELKGIGKGSKKGLMQLMRMVRGIKLEKEKVVSDLSITKMNMRKELKKAVGEMNERLKRVHNEYKKVREQRGGLQEKNRELESRVSELTESHQRETHRADEAEKTKEDLMQMIESANQGSHKKVGSVTSGGRGQSIVE
jgi:chromosome segregation ATPase